MADFEAIIEEGEMESILANASDPARFSSTASTMRRGGRYGGGLQSAVWDHFIYDSISNKSTCRHCSFQSSGRHAGNLKKHLRRHADAVADVERKTYQMRRKIHNHPSQSSTSTSTSSPQLSTVSWDPSTQVALSHILNVTVKGEYEQENNRYTEVMDGLALLFASQTLPPALVERPEFKHFVTLLDPSIELPNSDQLVTLIRNLYAKLKRAITSDIRDTKPCVILDTWTDENFSESYITIFIRYVDHNSVTVKQALIGLKTITGTLNASKMQRMLREVLAEWNISEENISFYITDNGAVVSRTTKECISEYGPLVAKDKEGLYQILTMKYEQSDIDYPMENEIAGDIEEFDRLENEHNSVFGYSKRVSCVINHVTCAIRKCIDGSSSLRPIFQAAFQLIAVINRSPIYKESVFEYSQGRVLLSPSRDHWTCTYYVLDRLLELREAVDRVVIEKGLSQVWLDPLMWMQVEQVKELLRPFVEATRELQMENSTLSKVVPAVIDLIERFSNHGTGSIAVAKDELKQEMEKRFARIYDPADVNFAPVHLLATFFDPEYIVGLTMEQRRCCVDIIVNDLSNAGRSSSPQAAFDNANAASDTKQKKFSGFFKRQSQVQTSVQTGPQSINEKMKLIKTKLDSYIEEACSSSGSDREESISFAPVAFWAAKRDTFGDIADYALNIFCAPAISGTTPTVAALKEIVQDAGVFGSTARCAEEEILIKANRSYLLKDHLAIDSNQLRS